MSVFIPQEWEVMREHDLSSYATKDALNIRITAMEDRINGKMSNYDRKSEEDNTNAINSHTTTMEEHIDKELLSYVKQTEGGDIDAENRKVINLADPISDSHAVSLRYMNTHKPKPIICITGEAIGSIRANTACFSFGARGATADVQNSGRSGVVLPTDGRIVYMTACSLNATGRGASRDDITFGIIGDGLMGVEPRLIVSILGGATKGTKTITVEHRMLKGGILNFYCLNNSPYSRIAIVSVFIELDI